MKVDLYGEIEEKGRELQQTQDREAKHKKFLQALKDENMIEVDLIDNSDTDQVLNKEFNWTITDYSSTEMKI